VGLLPQMRPGSHKVDANGFLTALEPNSSITLAAEEGTVNVVINGKVVHTFGEAQKKKLFAKVFIMKVKDAATIRSFSDCPDDGSKWDDAFG